MRSRPALAVSRTSSPAAKTYRVPIGMQALFAKTIRLADASSRLLVEGYLVEVH
jgi:hypothetical protein